MASRLASGAVSGTTTAHDTPSLRACQATPWAMFPALAVQIPSFRSRGSARAKALPAPRILKEPMGWRFSSFRKISQGDAGSSSGMSGVRRAVPAIRSRAARISSRETGSDIEPMLSGARRSRGATEDEACVVMDSPDVLGAGSESQHSVGLTEEYGGGISRERK